MQGDHNNSRSQLKGYLFEIVIMELLRKNNFSEIDVAAESRDRVRQLRSGFIELKGRGCWHQIDCPCDYNKPIPFSYPLRLLGEVKFHKNAIDKKHIREYIGVLKDIQENYFVPSGTDPDALPERKTEIGVYFSANGFKTEAAKLAYAHGIQTISYKNNYIINQIKNLIEELEEDYLPAKDVIEHWSDFRHDFISILRGTHIPNNPYFPEKSYPVLNALQHSLSEIKTSFIATSSPGVFFHFISDSVFPTELFYASDSITCRIHYDHDQQQNISFWLEFDGDEYNRKFYFTPPEFLDRSAIFGTHPETSASGRPLTLNMNIELNGILRNLTLNLDDEWLYLV